MAHSSQRKALLLAIRDEADAANLRLVDALRAAVRATQTQDVRRGMVVSSTSGAGKSVSFQVSTDLSPKDAIETAVNLWELASDLDDGEIQNYELESLMLDDARMASVTEIRSTYEGLRC